MVACLLNFRIGENYILSFSTLTCKYKHVEQNISLIEILQVQIKHPIAHAALAYQPKCDAHIHRVIDLLSF